MHDCEAPAGEAMAARPGEYYEVVDVRPRGSYSRRVRLAATVACAGALLAATAANVGGGGGAGGKGRAGLVPREGVARAR